MKAALALFLAFLCIPLALADGMTHIFDEDMWNLAPEEQQACAISYREGRESMILTVGLGTNLGC